MDEHAPAYGSFTSNSTFRGRRALAFRGQPKRRSESEHERGGERHRCDGHEPGEVELAHGSYRCPGLVRTGAGAGQDETESERGSRRRLHVMALSSASARCVTRSWRSSARRVVVLPCRAVRSLGSAKFRERRSEPEPRPEPVRLVLPFLGVRFLVALASPRCRRRAHAQRCAPRLPRRGRDRAWTRRSGRGPRCTRREARRSPLRSRLRRRLPRWLRLARCSESGGRGPPTVRLERDDGSVAQPQGAVVVSSHATSGVHASTGASSRPRSPRTLRFVSRTSPASSTSHSCWSSHHSS